MVEKHKITIDEVIAYLNHLLEKDPRTISKLFQIKAACNDELVKSPVHVIIDAEARPFVGLLGILNGLFGYVKHGDFRDLGAIGTLTNKEGVIRAFIKMEDMKKV